MASCAAAARALPCSDAGAAARAPCRASALLAPAQHAAHASPALRGAAVACARHVACGTPLRVCRRYPARRCAAAASASVARAPDTKAVDVFWRWLSAQGVDTSAVRPEQGPEGLGLVCTRAVRAGETVLSVPRSVWMTPATAAASPLGPHIGDQPPWVQLALHLLAERADPASRWAPYLALLPQELDSPVFWSEEELAELAGSQLGASAASYRTYVASVWEGVAAGPVAAAPAAFPAAVFSAASFAWAFGTLRARCLPPADAGPAIALVPGLDLVNHAADAAPAWIAARAAGGGLFAAAAAAAAAATSGPADAASAAAMAIVPGRAHAAGEQVLGSYGAGKLDSQTALDYGFADVATPQPGYLLDLAVPETDRFIDDKADVLEVAKQPAAPQFALRPGAAPPRELLTFLRLVHLSGTDAFLLEPLFRDAAWNLISEPVSLANETAVCKSMIDGCGAALSGYATSAAQDEQALRAPGISERRALAIRVRLGEKRALQATLEAYQTMLAAAPGLEYYQERRLRSLKLLDEGGKSTYDPFNDTFQSW